MKLGKFGKRAKIWTIFAEAEARYVTNTLMSCLFKCLLPITFYYYIL